MFAVIVETTDAKGSLHSSYVLVEGMEHRSVIANLVVAIHQSPAGQKHQRRHEQPVDELPTDDGGQQATAPSDRIDPAAVQDDEDDEGEITAHIYVDCQSVGTVSMAISLRRMIQQSPAGTLFAV